MRRRPHYLIAVFTRHRLAANLLMLIMILSGLWTLTQINTQFLPKFDIDVINVTIVWPGASAEDIENSIINPLERELRTLDQLKKIDSLASPGNSQIALEFYEGSDMSKALEDVRERVGRIRNLPKDSEKPIITRQQHYELIAKLIIYGPDDIEELRNISYEFEKELLNRGISKVTILGLPDRELTIEVSSQKISELKRSLPQIAQLINKRSQDIPAGKVGKSSIAKQFRTLEQRKSVTAFEQLPLINDDKGRLLKVSDIATVRFQQDEEQAHIFYQGKPAVELRLKRTQNSNTLESANIVHQWLEHTKPRLGKSLQIKIFDERWVLVKQRIDLLIKNGVSGLILIIIILFVMLNHHVAFWVVVGIPTSILASIAVLHLGDGTINMVSLFAFILTLGIIVDDTIVIGEQTLTNLHSGEDPLTAVENATRKMFTPILSSSLTTISAFFPLLFVSGIIGTVLFTIPLVVICVIIASLVECFLVLPGHLHHSFLLHDPEKRSKFRKIVNHAFDAFKERHYRRLIQYALKHRAITLSATFAIFLISIALVIGGHINFTFFPTPDGKRIITNVQFIAGTSLEKRTQFMNYLEKNLAHTEKLLKKRYNMNELATTHIIHLNRVDYNALDSQSGEQYASLTTELTSPDSRPISNAQFIRFWRSQIKLPNFVENFNIFSPKAGPPGDDIDIQLFGSQSTTLKTAAQELKDKLSYYPGVSGINDNLPFGQEQYIFSLNHIGKSLGLTIEDVGQQIRAALNGQIVQIYHEPNEEIEVKVQLPKLERDNISTIDYLPIVTSSSSTVSLSSIADIKFIKSPEQLRHQDTYTSVNVKASVDDRLNNANKILADLEKNYLQDLQQKYQIKVQLRGKAEEQAETMTDIKAGLIIAISLIYIILAWVFSSYLWPIVVMIAIPLGLIGAIWGHFFMNMDLTLLSLFGLFGLSGIVVNDSIILLTEYQHLKKQSYNLKNAIIEASCRRLRAVLLTSVTTIAGLTPLLFERSQQAQFLIPMAISVTFGLVFATLLILVIIPCILSYVEKIK